MEDHSLNHKLPQEKTQNLDHYRSIFQHLPFIVLIFNPWGRLIDANEEAHKVTGLEFDNYKGKTFLDFKLLNRRDKVKAVVEFSKNLKGQVTGKSVYKLKLSASRIICLEVIGIPIMENKKIVEVLVTGSDITERINTEEALQENIKELEQFKDAAVGRENRMIELKQEINELSLDLGKIPPYDLSFLD